MPSSNSSTTPLTNAPSMIQLRIVLIGLLLTSGAAVWWQSAGGNANHAVQKLSKTPVPDAVANIDFADAEASWSDLQIDAQGNLTIDAHTASALSETNALMTGDAFDLQTARIALLMERQLGATPAKQFMQLLPLLRSYEAVEQRWWAEHGSKQPPPFAKLFELQDDFLGDELAKALFSEQRRMAEMMLASHEIRNDPSLTETEMDKALRELQRAFEDEGDPIE